MKLIINKNVGTPAILGRALTTVDFDGGSRNWV
jgi:hypothetical protein